MSTLNARTEFAPPPTPGLLRALALAIAAHALLLGFLAMGVQWKHAPTPVTVEAELWSSIPQQAAAPAAEPEAETPPEPSPPVVEPKPTPVAPPPPAPVEPTPDPRIAIAREKTRLQKEKQALKDQEALEKQKLARLEEDKRQKEALKNKKLQAEKEAKEREAREKEQREKLARDKNAQKTQQQNAAKDAAEAKKLADLRLDNLRRIAGMAGGTGEAGSKGTAAQSSGPSAGYAGKIRARIKPNITYTESITGNPAAEVEVRATPFGTIISRKLTQSSGIKSWDDAVLNAIDKTEVLPTDTDGRTPPVLTLVFRPKD